MTAATVRAGMLGGGTKTVPVAYDFDARFGVVDDGSARCSQWTDTIVGAVATTAVATNRPDINIAIAANRVLGFSSSTAKLLDAPITGLFGQGNPFTLTMRVRPVSNLGTLHYFRLYYATTPADGAAYAGIIGSNFFLARDGLGGAIVTQDGAHGLVNDTWYTLGFGWASGTSSFWKNGVLSGTVANTEPITQPFTSITIGNSPSAANAMRAYLGRLRVYAAELAAPQHAADHALYAPLWA